MTPSSCLSITPVVSRDEAWLTRWLKSPEQMLQADADAKAMLDKYKLPMPNQGLSEAEIKQYIAYFRWADEHLQPQGKSQPQPSAPGTSLPPSQTRSATPMPGTEVEHESATAPRRNAKGER